ncbi:protein phosphatase 2C domain-containing protein [Aquibium oceanicum]|uniref:PPM-type phosphatase domain-containing protein n=1 Tax=Aquibium oceanicum TaxID=1670800 RepID=A0A1L3SKY1_9HYPH|nr:protein phosphatase 2C domain-containing protein [Aquibium oceanicum]APH70040.1 hypothetical protein BSQ44_00585 [Aquibium oceanicum]
MLRWVTASFSHTGTRECNDDAVCVRRITATKRRYGLLIVADGVGSIAGSGQLARRICDIVPTFVEKYLLSRYTKRDIAPGEIADLAHAIKMGLNNTDNLEMLCSTFACAIVGRRTVAIYWAGDSRIYALYEDGRVLQASEDDVDINGALTRYVKGDVGVVGNLNGRIITADHLQLIAVATDGVYQSCTKQELTSFLLYLASNPDILKKHLASDFEAFAGGNISDNATMAVLASPKHTLRVKRAAHARLRQLL